MPRNAVFSSLHGTPGTAFTSGGGDYTNCREFHGMLSSALSLERLSPLDNLYIFYFKIFMFFLLICFFCVFHFLTLYILYIFFQKKDLRFFMLSMSLISSFDVLHIFDLFKNLDIFDVVFFYVFLLFCTIFITYNNSNFQDGSNP